jgi:hypothetical protein
MIRAGEIVLDMRRVLDTLVKARRFLAAQDSADAIRAGSTTDRPSALRIELEHAEEAGNRVYDYITEGTASIAPTRDGGPL